MKCFITSEVNTHHTNDDYSCVVVEWSSDDNHLQRNKRGNIDWLPKDEEMTMIIRKFVELYGTSWLNERVREVKPAPVVDEGQTKLDDLCVYEKPSE